MWRLRAPVLVAVASALRVLWQGHPLFGIVIGCPGLLLGLPNMSALTRLLHLRRSKGHVRVFGDRSHVPRLLRWRGFWRRIGRFGSRGVPTPGWCRFFALGVGSPFAHDLLSPLFRSLYQATAPHPSLGWLLPMR